MLNADKAYADYVAGFFSSDYGYMIRESVTTGATIPKINKQTLAKAQVLLPPVVQQASMVGTNNAIRSLLFELRDKKKMLWANLTFKNHQRLKTHLKVKHLELKQFPKVPISKHLRRLVERLGAEDYKQRQAAFDSLISERRNFLGWMETARRNAKEPEVRLQLKKLIHQIFTEEMKIKQVQ